MKKKNVIILSILLFLIIFFIISYYVKDRYSDNLIKEIDSKKIINNILSVYKNNDNYIVVSKDRIYVLDAKYEIIIDEDKSKLYKRKYSSIVYKRNMLMYEEKISDKNYLVYRYYDIYTNELIDEIKIRR